MTDSKTDGRDPSQRGSSSNGEIERRTFEEVLNSFDTGMLVTQTSRETLRSRPMRIAAHDGSGRVTFITSMEGSVVEEIQWDEDINVSLQAAHKFLSITGKAECSRDKKRIEELWNTGWKVWFPEGPEDPSIVLVRLNPSWGEYWDISGAKGVRYLIEIGKALATGKKVEFNDPVVHAKVELADS